MGDLHDAPAEAARRPAGASPSLATVEGDGPARAAIPEGFGAPVLLALQRAAGNAAVSRLVAASGRPRRGEVAVQRYTDKPQQHPTLRWGSHRDEVGELQTRLNEEGVATPPLEVDCWFGPLTNAAVREFQARHGLQVDGVVGIRTWGVLDELQARGVEGPTRTVLDEMAPVDQTQHEQVETILHPAQDELEMIGTGPGGAYELAMCAALDAYYGKMMGDTAAAPATDMDHVKRIAEAAQSETESFFGAEIVMASRKPSGSWHPGSSAEAVKDAAQTTLNDAEVVSWMPLFMDNERSPGPAVAAQFHYNDQRRSDLHEHDRVRDVWLARYDGRRKVREVARVYPLSMSPGEDVAVGLRYKEFQGRAGMWMLFSGLSHECLHMVTHPNYEDAATAIGGQAYDALIEGMTDHFTQELWDAVRPRIVGDVVLRSIVEGPFFEPIVAPADYGAGGEVDNRVKSHTYPSMARAEEIVGTVGETNARAAFFMGHPEALGIGPSSAHVDPLEGLAGWQPTSPQPDRYVVPPGGETVWQIQLRTGSPVISDDSGIPYDDPAEHVPEATILTVPGLRWHTTIAQDTLGQIANQHGIGQEALERANKLPHRDPATPVPPSQVLMIPVTG